MGLAMAQPHCPVYLVGLLPLLFSIRLYAIVSLFYTVDKLE